MDIECDHNDGLGDVLFNGDHMKLLYSEWCNSELLFSLININIVAKQFSFLTREKNDPEYRTKVGPKATKQDVNSGFEFFSFPEVGGETEELDEQAQRPEDCQAKAKGSAEWGGDEFLGRAEAKQANEENDNGYEKGVYLHELPVDQAQALQFGFPVEIPRKDDMQ